MTPSTLRQLWATVESTQSATLLQLDDHHLVNVLIDTVTTNHSLTDPEIEELGDYIHSRIALIRDLATSRCAA